MADIAIPFSDNGRDVIITNAASNKIKYIAKSVEFSTEPVVTALRIKRVLRRHGIDAEVTSSGDKITIRYKTELITL